MINYYLFLFEIENVFYGENIQVIKEERKKKKKKKKKKKILFN